MTPAKPGAKPVTKPGAKPWAKRKAAVHGLSQAVVPGQVASDPKNTKSRLRKGPSPLPSRPRSSSDELRYSLARRLTDRDRRIVRAIARHRVLTSVQLTEMFFDSQKPALARLLGLYRLGVLDRFQPHRGSWGSHPFHYVLGPLGAAVLASEAGEDPDRAARRWKADRTVALGHTQRLAHLVGVNGFLSSLVGHSRRHENSDLVAWLTEAECARWSEGIVRPDAFGEWREDGSAVEFFLEYDRGTETLARLVDKLPGYERFEAERGASSWVVFCFPSPRREATARAALAGATVPAATAALAAPLRPADALWAPLSGDGRRVRLAALGAMTKPTEALRRAATGGPRAWRFERSQSDHEEAPIETP